MAVDAREPPVRSAHGGAHNGGDMVVANHGIREGELAALPSEDDATTRAVGGKVVEAGEFVPKGVGNQVGGNIRELSFLQTDHKRANGANDRTDGATLRRTV